MSKNFAIVNLSSGDYEVQAGNRFSAQLGTPLKNCLYYQVLTAEIPFSYYVVNSTNNAFYFTQTAPGAPTTYLITIPEGNYNTAQLGVALAILLTTATTTVYTVDVVDTVNDPLGVRGRYTITGPGGSIFSLDATTARLPNSAFQIIGASGTAVTNSVAQKIYLPYVSNVTGDQFIFLNCANLNQGYNYGGSNTTNMLVKIPVNGGFGNTIFYTQRLASEWTEFCVSYQQDFSNMTFYLTDSNGALLDLHGVHWSLSIGFRRRPE